VNIILTRADVTCVGISKKTFTPPKHIYFRFGQRCSSCCRVAFWLLGWKGDRVTTALFVFGVQSEMARSYKWNLIPVDFQLLCPRHILGTQCLHIIFIVALCILKIHLLSHTNKCTNYNIYYLKSVLIIDIKTLSYFHSSYMFQHIICHPQGALMFLTKITGKTICKT
jgi:hypothetical protein